MKTENIGRRIFHNLCGIVLRVLPGILFLGALFEFGPGSLQSSAQAQYATNTPVPTPTPVYSNTFGNNYNNYNNYNPYGYNQNRYNQYGNEYNQYGNTLGRRSKSSRRETRSERDRDRSRRNRKEKNGVIATKAPVNAVSTPAPSKTMTQTAPKIAVGGAVKQGIAPAIKFPPKGLPANLFFVPLDIHAEQGQEFDAGVMLSNNSASMVSSFQFTVAYDPIRLRFIEFRVPTESPFKGDAAAITMQRGDGMITLKGTFPKPTSDSRVPLLVLRFSANGNPGLTRLQFLNGLDYMPSVETNGVNLLADPQGVLKGTINANVIIQPGAAEAAMAMSSSNGATQDSRERQKVPEPWETPPSEESPQSPVRLSLQAPEETNAVVGEDFWVDMVLWNKASAPINAIGVFLKFDPSVLQVMDEDRGNWIAHGVNAWDGAFHESYPFNMIQMNTVDNQRGTINYQVGRSSTAWPFPTGIFARVHFKAIKSAEKTTITMVKEGDMSSEETYVRSYGEDKLQKTWNPKAAPEVAMSVKQADSKTQTAFAD